MTESQRAVKARVAQLTFSGGQVDTRLPKREDGTLRRMDLYHLALDPVGVDGRAVYTDGRETVALGIRFHTEWTASLEFARAEIRLGPPVPGDRDGSLVEDLEAPSTVDADACLVHGGPAGRSAAEIALVARGVREAWAKQGPGFVRRPVTVKVGEATMPWTPGGQAADWRLYAVALEDDGRAGRAVLTNGKSTLAIRVERDGGSWVLVETDWEQRAGDAVRDYEDGRLYGR